jgi:phospholipid/cholesterol/gamma-HCH transport system ATP-binding protein
MMNEFSQSIIQVRGLKASYGEKIILQDINFQVRRGEVFVILGGSGSGKSTLLKSLVGLYRPLEGEVWIEGSDLVAAKDDERLRLLRKFGVMYQSGALFGSMTVLENVRLPLDEFTLVPDEVKELIALAKLKLVGLGAAAQKLPSELSGGMQKRAAIARAMALDPRILFLDEPSAGLDPVTSAGLDLLIKELSHHFGITFVIVTHELASIYAIADRVIMLDGRIRSIIAEGKPADLRESSTDHWVRQFFNREPDSAEFERQPSTK